MKQNIKEGIVSKDLESLKRNESMELGVQDFFNNRDKGNRGTKGLVEDSKKILGEEVSVKQELYDRSLEVNSMPNHIAPLFSGIFLTARRNKLVDNNGLFLPTASYGKGSDTDMDQDFSDTQLVLATGPHAQQVQAGMEVVVNMDNFKKRLESNMAQKLNREFEFVLPIEKIEGVEYLYITERDVKYISNINGVDALKNK